MPFDNLLESCLDKLAVSHIIKPWHLTFGILPTAFRPGFRHLPRARVFARFLNDLCLKNRLGGNHREVDLHRRPCS